MLNLAIALAQPADALLLDEPTATLAPTSATGCGLAQRAARGGMALMFSTESVNEAMRHGDRMIVLAAGRLLFTGSPAEMVRVHGIGADGDAEAAELAFMRLVEPPGMRAAGCCFRKDLRLLGRAPALLLRAGRLPAAGRPAGGAGAAIGRAATGRRPGRPRLLGALGGGGPPRLSIADCVQRLSEDVNVRELEAADAEAALNDGRVPAVLTIREGFRRTCSRGCASP